jgi:hypothetical protein
VDGALSVQGLVYEQLDVKDSQGIIYIDRQMPEGMSLKPLPGVVVRFDPKAKDGNTTNSNSGYLRPSPITDANGYFSHGWMYYPYEAVVTVTVEQEGYYSISKDFTINTGTNDTLHHSFVIILVRK